MSGSRKNTFFYNPHIDLDHLSPDEAAKKISDTLKNAPKPSDHPNQNVTVAPKFNMTGRNLVFTGSGVKRFAHAHDSDSDDERSDIENTVSYTTPGLSK